MSDKNDKRLDAIILKILDERNNVDVKPYSHNIIALMLEMVSNEYGQERANKLIVDLQLEELGWQVVK